MSTVVMYMMYLTLSDLCRWTENEVNQRLEVKMKEAFDGLWDTSVRKDIPLRTAAFVVSLERVAKATLERGFQ